MARIDNFLFRRHTIKQGLVCLFTTSDSPPFLQRHLEYLASNLNVSKREVADALLGMLSDTNSLESRIARLVLWECTDPYVLERLETLSKRASPSSPHYPAMKMLAERWCAPTWLHSLPKKISEPTDENLKRLELHLARADWEPEEVAELWLIAVAHIESALRIQLLKNANRHAAFQLPMVARVEMMLHDEKVLSALTYLLAEHPGSEAGYVLEAMTKHPLFGIRSQAQRALENWRSGKRISPTPPPQNMAAWIADDAMTGYHHIIHVAEEPRDNFKLVYCAVDSWDNGLYKCWGHPRLDAEEVPLLRDYLARSCCTGALTPLEPALARGWIIKGVELSHVRKYRVPYQWSVWCRLLENSGPYLAPPEVIFGRHCIKCRRPIRRELLRETRSLVYGPVAICSMCLRKIKQCDCCGKKQTIKKMRVVAHLEVGQVDFLCESCYEKQASPPPKRPRA